MSPCTSTENTTTAYVLAQQDIVAAESRKREHQRDGNAGAKFAPCQDWNEATTQCAADAHRANRNADGDEARDQADRDRCECRQQDVGPSVHRQHFEAEQQKQHSVQDFIIMLPKPARNSRRERSKDTERCPSG